MDVIDSQVAARIAKAVPGRGYVRVGHDQLVEFQAGRVGGRRRNLSSTRIRPFLRALTVETLYLPAPRIKETESEDDVTDLDALVDAIAEASSMQGIPRPQSPWLPPLPETLLLTDLDDGSDSKTPEGLIPFGREDFPAERQQGTVSLDLGHGAHLMIAGDPGSGRSTALGRIAAAAAIRLDPTDLHLYGIDCGNGALLALGELPQCGAVCRARRWSERTDS